MASEARCWASENCPFNGRCMVQPSNPNVPASTDAISCGVMPCLRIDVMSSTTTRAPGCAVRSSSRSVRRETTVMTRESSSRAVAASSKGRHGFRTITSCDHPASLTVATSWAVPTARQSLLRRSASRARTSSPRP